MDLRRTQRAERKAGPRPNAASISRLSGRTPTLSAGIPKVEAASPPLPMAFQRCHDCPHTVHPSGRSVRSVRSVHIVHEGRGARNLDPKQSPGFTLIELIVVLTILGILAAAVIPIFRDTTENLREERAMRDLYGTLKFAQERAVSETNEYRVYLDEKRGRYWTSRMTGEKNGEKTFAALEEPYLEPVALPDGVKLIKPKAHRDRKLGASYISFYPSGACDVASVTLERKDGRNMTIATKGKLGQFKTKEGR